MWGRRRRVLSPVAGALLALTLVLGGCAQVTTLDTKGQVGKYEVTTHIDPKTLNPPQYGSFSYDVVDTTTNQPVTQFAPTIGALVQTVLIRRDLQNFWHSYTDSLVSNSASVSAYFPIFSKYYNYTLFTPSGSDQKVLTST